MTSILLIDDDHNCMEIMGEWLKHEGHTPIALHQPPEMQDILKNNRIDLILQDEYLQTHILTKLAYDRARGGMSQAEVNRRVTKAYSPGIVLTGLLRANDYKGLLYVMVANLEYAPANLVQTYLKYGAKNVIDKPVNLKKFTTQTLPLILDTIEERTLH